MKRKLHLVFGMLLVCALASCRGGATFSPAFASWPGVGSAQDTPEPFDLAQDKVVSAPTSPPPAPGRVSPDPLPPICNCVLRFDHINIEEGLSQSSVRVIFQDSRGFLWFG